MLSLSLLFASECISKTKEIKKFAENIQILENHLRENKLFGLMIILHFIKHPNILFNLLLDSSNEELKKETFKLIYIALLSVLKEEQKEKTATMKFLQVLLIEGIEYTKTKEIKADYIFALLKDFITDVDTGAKLLLEMGCVRKVISYLSQATKGKETTRFSEPSQFLCNLLSHCVTNEMAKLKSVPEGFPAFKENSIIIPESEISLFFTKWSIMELVTHNQKALTSILRFLSWENRDRSIIIIQQIVKCFYELRATQNCNHALRILRDIVYIQDTYSEDRINFALFKTGFDKFECIVDYLCDIKNDKEDIALEILFTISELLNLQKVKEIITKDYLKKFDWVSAFLSQKPGNIKTLSYNIWTSSDASKKKDFIKKQFASIQEIDNRKEVIEIMEDEHNTNIPQAGNGYNNNDNRTGNEGKEEKKAQEPIPANEVKKEEVKEISKQ